jgi:hypothetical protein
VSEELKIRLIQARVEAMELRNGQDRGDLLPRREVELRVADLISRMRLLLLSLPGRCSLEIAEICGRPQSEVQQLLRAGVIRALNELSEGERRAAEEAAAEAEAAAVAAEAQPEPAEVPIRSRKRKHRRTGRRVGRPIGSVGIRSY